MKKSVKFWSLVSVCTSVILLSTGYSLGQVNAPDEAQADKALPAEYEAALKEYSPGMQETLRKLSIDQLELFLAYSKMREGYKIPQVDRFVAAYDKGKTDPSVIKEAATIGITNAKEGDNGPLLMALIALEQRQVEQNDKIISLLQDTKKEK